MMFPFPSQIKCAWERAAARPPRPCLAPSPSFPGTHSLLCFLRWSCLSCVIFVDECGLLRPEGSAGNTKHKQPDVWAPTPPGTARGQPLRLHYLRGAVRLREDSGSRRRPRSISKGQIEPPPRRGRRGDALVARACRALAGGGRGGAGSSGAASDFRVL